MVCNSVRLSSDLPQVAFVKQLLDFFQSQDKLFDVFNSTYYTL